ncbi:MAG: phosphate ABC transporter permease subunit PstC [Defluviitaleaceae bacterium]|nr:phosphate ABC transporter permease subunit PstC [Defluviitaleaceae bacterium]
MKFREQGMKAVFLICAASSVVFVFLICLFLFINGIPPMLELGVVNFLTGTNWRPTSTPPSFGLLPMIITSFITTAGALVLGVPVGICTAVFMARVCPKPLYRALKPAIDLLAGIPSVVYGFFGLVIIVPMIRDIFGGRGFSVLAAIVLLSIMILPTVISISEAALRAVPETYYEGALALGSSHIRSAFFVVLPAAKSGILASVVLGMGRALGETMAVVMLAGNQPRIPGSLLEGARSLTANIVLEMAYATDIHRDALVATAIVLFVMILTINLTFSFFIRRGGR